MPTKVKPLPSIEVLNKAFCYDPESGILYWRERDGVHWTVNRRDAGKPAGTKQIRGEISVTLAGSHYLAHRIIFKMIFGTEPDGIDHRDLDPSNNRPANLRAADQFQNLQNTTATKRSVLGIKGVSFRADCGKYTARIMSNRQVHRLGVFETVEEAQSAYAQAARRLHGEFARTA